MALDAALVVPDGVVGRALRLLFVAYLAATALHIALVMAHEPFAFDAWNMALDTRGEPFTLRRFFAYGAFEYTHSNPRLGQWLTYLAYKLTLFASIATPLAYLALAVAVTVLGLGRWPWRRDRDLALTAFAVGALWFAIPRIGMIMFCRAYGANYLYSAAIQLWFLVPLRLRPDGAASRGACLAYALAGVAAGMCNEHTGPTLLLGLAGYAVWRWRTTGTQPRLAWCGLAGAAIGFLAIFFAPGQGSRYDGLATKVSLVGRLIQRGVTGNLDIFNNWLIGCAPVLGLVVIAVVLARRDAGQPLAAPLRRLGWALLAGSLITATVFVSPKLGPRFYLLGSALVLAAFVGVADVALTTQRRLAPFVGLAVAASIYAGARSLPLYLRLSDASDARMAALAAAPPGSVFTAESFEQIEDSWWFLGDDFRDIKKRELVADYFGLRGVVFRAIDVDAPLGVSDVILAARATPADNTAGFAVETGTYRGIDIVAVHKAVVDAIERVRQRGAPLEQLDVVVDFVGARPPLPRPSLVVARWRPSGLEAYDGVIERKVGSWRRAIKVPKAVPDDAEIYAYVVGGEARRLGTARAPELTYEPWKRGTYWALACGARDCFVIAAARFQ